ncbi:MAG: GerAB/ArcD/ProY family transporter [Oscillospiraceae bacterium]|nr:GerAB/ArcD/ProY family transporter [Oscillospiraceae bacterium]
MTKDSRISENQLAATAFVLMLSPALRLFPGAAAESAGRSAPLAALLAFFPAALYLYLACRAAALRREGEGLCALIARAVPGRVGRMLLGLLWVWLVVYAGFVLRSGADRFIVAVYPNAPSAFFVLTLGAAALAAAFAPYRDAARTAKLVLPAVGGVLALVLLSSLGKVRAENLLPLRPESAKGLAVGAVPGFDVLAWTIWAPAFALGEAKKGAPSFPRLLGALALFCAVLALMSLAVVGSFGAPLAASLSWPFFSLVRNLVFLRSVERVEALVVALWVFPDFLIVSLFLRAARDALSLSLGSRAAALREGRLVLPLCAASACAFALLAAPDAAALSLLSRTLIPAVNLFFALVFFPAIILTGKKKGRL